jgi:chromosome partitioning protein
MIDADPQGNATSGLGINKRGVVRSVYQLLTGDADFESCVVKSPYAGFSVIPSSMDLAGAELELVDAERREFRLKDAVLQHKKDYDFILIDCPPSLGLLTLNGLNACDSILIPIQCEYYALEGLSQLMSSVRSVKRLYNPFIEIEGVLVTMYDSRLNLTLQVVDEVKRFFPGKVFSSVVPRNVRLSEAPSYGKPIKYYDAHSKGAVAYDNLASEIIRNNSKEV